MRRLSEDIQSFYPIKWPFEQIVEKLPDEGKLLEIGPYLGKSTVTWAEEFEKAGKNWTIHTIDLFMGVTKIGRPDNASEELTKHLDSLLISEEEHLPTFLENIQGWENITYEKNFFTEDYDTGGEIYNVVWYDGLHDYEHVSEFLRWYEKNYAIRNKKLKGYNRTQLIVDCYDDLHPGTIKACNEFPEKGTINWTYPREILSPSEGKKIIWI